MVEKFQGLFDARRVKGDSPRKIPNIGVAHGFRGSPREKLVGLEVIKTGRIIAELIFKEVMLDKWLDARGKKVREKVQEPGKRGEVDGFLGRTGEMRNLGVKSCPSKCVRLSVKRNLEKPGEETG